MKSMTCKELGGACDKVFRAETFDEIAAQSQQHGMKMYKQGEKEHIKAMEAMKELMADPKAMTQWMDAKKQDFTNRPAD